MDIPTESDWRSVPWGPDTPYAYDHFYGKDLGEASALIADNALYYQEDIVFMPVACFYFYAHAYIDYLMADASKGDSDGASCFFGLVESRKDDIRGGPIELKERVRALLQRLADRQAWYDAPPDVYGDFTRKSAACLRSIAERKGL